ncbi:uncharacterized protein J3D65DRAFT_34386 [Phyllosticta citribraziliensis]|uniref:Uncharacterized protein n=1 Tax=Phyllosticta citribraziliensis TaxID=989973 RepID=A0ABR1MB99_9PEZI
MTTTMAGTPVASPPRPSVLSTPRPTGFHHFHGLQPPPQCLLFALYRHPPLPARCSPLAAILPTHATTLCRPPHPIILPSIQCRTASTPRLQLAPRDMSLRSPPPNPRPLAALHLLEDSSVPPRPSLLHCLCTPETTIKLIFPFSFLNSPVLHHARVRAPHCNTYMLAPCHAAPHARCHLRSTVP